MARHKFLGDFVQFSTGLPAANVSFTWWTDPVAGSQITDVLASDGVSAASFKTDSQGNRPTVYGPNGIEAMYCDTGASIRYAVYADDVQVRILDEEPNISTALATAQQALAIAQAGGGGTGTGELPAGTTLDAIPNGSTRFALSVTDRDKLANVPTTFLQLGTTATTALRGNYVPPTPTPTAIGAVANGRNASSIWVFSAAEGLPTVAQATSLGIPVGALIAVLSS